jgi:hypothetical protein
MRCRRTGWGCADTLDTRELPAQPGKFEQPQTPRFWCPFSKVMEPRRGLKIFFACSHLSARIRVKRRQLQISGHTNCRVAQFDAASAAVDGGVALAETDDHAIFHWCLRCWLGRRILHQAAPRCFVQEYNRGPSPAWRFAVLAIASQLLRDLTIRCAAKSKLFL